MNDMEFHVQMDRLIKQWPNQYTKERANLIYEKLKSFPVRYWKQAVEDMLLNSKYAPVPSELISSAINSSRREASWSYSAKWDDQCVEHGTYPSDEEASYRAKMIQDRLNHLVDDDVYQDFLEDLRHKARRALERLPDCCRAKKTEEYEATQKRLAEIKKSQDQWLPR